MVHLIDDCSSCGGFCCRVITLGSKTLSRYRDLNWRRLSPREALERNPFLPEGLFLSDSLDFYFYATCADLTERGTCGIYDMRPDVCRGYPFYGMLEVAHTFIFTVPWCRYREDALIIQGIPYKLVPRKEIESVYQDPDQFYFIGGRKNSPLPPEHRPSRNKIENLLNDFRLEKFEYRLDHTEVPRSLVERSKAIYRSCFQRGYKRVSPRLKDTPFEKAILFCLQIGLSVDRFFSFVVKFSGQKLVPPNQLNSPRIRKFVLEQLK